jgi:hypothetical protein
MTGSGWRKARNKITDGTDWRGTVAVPLGDETIEIGHRLLTESEFFRVKEAIDLAELQQYEDEAMDDEMERLQELQAKNDDDLTPTEQEELEELSTKLAVKQSELQDKLGDDVYEELLWAGRKAIHPTDEDVSEFMNDLEWQKQLNDGDPIEGTTRKRFEQVLKADMEQMVDDQPYPIKYMVGQAAFKESMQLLGNAETSG